MKKIFTFFGALLIASFILSSCSNPQKKAISNYCNCLKTVLNDTIINYETVNTLEKKCYDSLILQNKSLSENKEFIDGFYQNDDITKLQNKINQKIIDNVQNILKKFSFVANYNQNYQIPKYTFDGKIAHYSLIQIDLRGSYIKANDTRKYIINTDKNGKTYVEITISDGKSVIYEFGKTYENKKKDYYLSGPVWFWAQDVK